MHSFNSEGVTIHHNGDLSDDVYIERLGVSHVPESIKIPAKVLLDFVAGYVRDKRIGKIENMSTEEVLGL